MIFTKELFVDARFVVETLEMRRGCELDQIFVAGVIFCEQGEMVALVVDARSFVEAGAVRDICFHADDRFDLVFFAQFVKFDRAVHVAMVGESHRRHAEFFRRRHHILELLKPIEETIV